MESRNGVTALPERTEDEIVSRAAISVELGGRAFALQPRVISAGHVWQESVRTMLEEKLARIDSIEGLGLLMGGSPETLLAFVRSYDNAGVLPSGEWLAEHVTAEEARAAFGRLFDHEFPFFALGRELLPGAQQILTPALVRVVLESPSAPSTNEPARPITSDHRRSSRRR